MSGEGPANTAPKERLRREVEDLLFLEADLLDERRFRDWLALFTDDARYFMPERENTLSGAVEDELRRPGEAAYFDETKRSLEMRVARLETGLAWAETPPSRTRHLITNIRIKSVRRNGGVEEIEVWSNFLAYRTRLETDQDLYVGVRKDHLRRTGASLESPLRIADRTIVLDQTVLAAKNISIFL